MKDQKGFTFIELILYITILTIILSAIVPFALGAVGSSAKSAVQQEVSSNARYISERIRHEIRNAIGINSVSSTSIDLATDDSLTNPTIIDLSGGNIRIRQGTSLPINLNSNGVVISNLIFTNYSSGDNKTKNIQFNFIVDSSASLARQEYQATVNVEADAELRSN